MHIELPLAFFQASTWADMFTLDTTVTWTEKILRPAIVYVALIVLLRVFGKRELAQLNPFDLVVILSLSNTVQNAIIGQDNSVVGGIVGAAALLGMNYFIALLKYSSKSIESTVEGRPVCLVHDGKINERALKRELITRSDLDTIAHHNGFEDAGALEMVVIDPNGSVLVDGKEEVKDVKFKKDVLKKINAMSKQLTELTAALQKG